MENERLSQALAYLVFSAYMINNEYADKVVSVDKIFSQKAAFDNFSYIYDVIITVEDDKEQYIEIVTIQKADGPYHKYVYEVLCARNRIVFESEEILNYLKANSEPYGKDD